MADRGPRLRVAVLVLAVVGAGALGPGCQKTTPPSTRSPGRPQGGPAPPSAPFAPTFGIAKRLSCDGLLARAAPGTEEEDGAAGMAYLVCKGCKEGMVRGCIALGVLYEEGEGVEQDHEKAATLYRVGCDNLFAPGCARLAGLYERGQGPSSIASRRSAVACRTIVCGGP